MSGDYTVFLWLLKLGALVDLYLLLRTAAIGPDPFLAIPALIFLAVCAYRCLFPVRYEHYIVFHDSVWSSVFATGLLATFAEVAFTFLQACVLERPGNQQRTSYPKVLSSPVGQAQPWVMSRDS